MTTVRHVDLKASFGQNVAGLSDFCKDNHLKITDTNGNGIFDIDDTVEYSVQRNDSLWAISRKFEGCSFNDIKGANKERYPNMDSIRENDSVIIPLKKTTEENKPVKSADKKEEQSFVTRDFGNIKTRTITDEETKKLFQNQTAESLKKKGYYFIDNNKNGKYDEGDELYRQVTVMLDAGHGIGKYLKPGQKISIPGKKDYTTKENDTLESIAKAHGISVEQLERTNPNAALGYDPGAESPFGELNEADLNGIATEELAKKLEAQGFNVVIGERTDKPHIRERVNEKLSESPDMYISIHCNSVKNTPQANGEEVIYRDNRDLPFAKALNESLKKDSTFKNREIKQSELIVLNKDKDNKIAEAMVELGFVSNSGDYSKLIDSSTRNNQLQAISDGVVNYYNQHKKP